MAHDHAETEYLRARCLLIVDFVSRVDASPVLSEMRKIVNKQADRGNLSGLRILRQDLLEMTRMLAAENRVLLEAALASQERDDPVHHRR